MKISILLGGSCALPPEAIGAVEILWFNVGMLLASRGHDISLIGKGNAKVNRNATHFSCRVIDGFDPSGRTVTVIRAFRACVQMFRVLGECDVLVVNNVWAVLVARFFKKKFKVLVTNVQRMPKGFFALRNRGADLYICPTGDVARRVRHAFGGQCDEKVVVIPNPVDVKHFNDVGRTSRPENSVIVYHGRIHREKGLDILAKAVAIVARSRPDVRLKLIGAHEVSRGGSGDAYKKEIELLSGGRVNWVDAISERDRLAREISACSVYCYPSVAEDGETFGVAPLEAMSLGLPVIVSKLRCFEDFLRDGVTGLTFDHRNARPESELAEKIMSILSRNELRRRLALNAAAFAQRFSTESVASKVEDSFNALLKKRGIKCE